MYNTTSNHIRSMLNQPWSLARSRSTNNLKGATILPTETRYEGHAYDWLVRYWKADRAATEKAYNIPFLWDEFADETKAAFIAAGYNPHQEKENNLYEAFNVNAYSPETGDIFFTQVITAKNSTSARDKAIRLLDANVDLDTVKVTVTPLG